MNTNIATRPPSPDPAGRLQPVQSSEPPPRRALSGITPSGRLTLGNYLGALRRFVERQDGADHVEGHYFVADLHALTSGHETARIRQLTLETAGLFLAAGLDPERSVLFIQSHVREHVELSYLLESTVYVGELNRMIQFKEKGAHPQTRASLFTYPCLMAADILLYDTHQVPVGGDQDQHVELCRHLAVRFNRLYGDTFIVPELSRAALTSRVADLSDPTVKMSKSADDSAAGVVRLLDPPDVVRRKVNRAVTDSDNEVRYDPESKPGVSNLLAIIAAVDGVDPAACAAGISSYRQLKTECTDRVIACLSPLQQRHAELMAEPQELTATLQRGAERAAQLAAPVLARARTAIGLM